MEWDWVHVVLRPMFGLLYQSQMIDVDDCGIIGGLRIGRGNRSTRRKPTPVPLCPPKIPHDLTQSRTRAATKGSRRQQPELWHSHYPHLIISCTLYFSYVSKISQIYRSFHLTVRSHFMREMFSWRSRVIHEKFWNMYVILAEFLGGVGDSHYFKFCARSETLLIYFMSHYFKFAQNATPLYVAVKQSSLPESVKCISWCSVLLTIMLPVALISMHSS
jgi:hypothetical protein